MTTRRPYLIRAFNDWILDNGFTPYLSVDADYQGVEVPRSYVIDGEIVLNISPASVRNLEMGLEYLLFDARFSGQLHHIVIPVKAVLAIFAKENGEGMAFMYKQGAKDQSGSTQEMVLLPSEDMPEDGEEDPVVPPPGGPQGGRPNLKVVK